MKATRATVRRTQGMIVGRTKMCVYTAFVSFRQNFSETLGQSKANYMNIP